MVDKSQGLRGSLDSLVIRNGFDFDVRSQLYRLTGVDLTEINGMSENNVLTIVSETGLDMNVWPTEKHFSSWLGLSPGSKITGGKRLSGRTKPSPNRAAAAFRLAAYSLASSKTALGAFYRRLRNRLGSPKAITATAHKLARLFYHLLKNQIPFIDLGQDYCEQQYQERVIRNLKRRAAELGYKLIQESTDGLRESMC